MLLQQEYPEGYTVLDLTETCNTYRILVENLIEDREGHEDNIQKDLTKICFARMAGGWNWLMIVSKGALPH
jgi:hypothetical protein